jgi:hypothetical protein
MERLFSPCTRLRDMIESQGPLIPQLDGRTPELLQELNLHVSTEEFLSAESRPAFTYAHLYAMLGKGETVAWLTPHAFVTLDDGRARQCWGQLRGATNRINFDVDGKEIVAWARSHEHVMEICDVIARVLGASVVSSVHLTNCTHIDYVRINAPTLTYLMEQCRSLKELSLRNLEMDENHCRVLGIYSRTGLEIELKNCIFMTHAGASALAEILGRNQGPTRLDWCCIDNSVLANGLRGNSRLTFFRPRIFSQHRDADTQDVLAISQHRDAVIQGVLAIADALRENKGLVSLELNTGRSLAIDETCDAVFDSLKTHPTLEVLNLNNAFQRASMVNISLRILALADMLKVNLSIHTIHMPGRYSENQLFRGKVIPYLETNRLRPRLLAIQKTRSIPYRTKVLGRALLAVRTNRNCFWMLLSGNAEVAFPSTAATVSLPTPATAAATSNAAPIVAPSVPTGPPAANGAIGKKRKARP